TATVPFSVGALYFIDAAVPVFNMESEVVKTLAFGVEVGVAVGVGVGFGDGVGLGEGPTGPFAEPDSPIFFCEPLVALLVIRIDEWNSPLADGSNITVTVLDRPGARSKEPPPLIIQNGAEADPTLPATDVLPLTLTIIERVCGTVTRPNDR